MNFFDAFKYFDLPNKILSKYIYIQKKKVTKYDT